MSSSQRVVRLAAGVLCVESQYDVVGEEGMEDRTEGRGVTAKVVREKRKEQRALAQTTEAEEEEGGMRAWATHKVRV